MNSDTIINYPTLNIQLFEFSFETCPICRVIIVSEFISTLFCTFYKIEAISIPSQFSWKLFKLISHSVFMNKHRLIFFISSVIMYVSSIQFTTQT